MASAKNLRSQMAILAEEIEKIEKYGEDDFDDETVLVIKKHFFHGNMVTVATCPEHGIVQSEYKEECTCRPVPDLVYTYTLLKIRGGWYISGVRDQGRKTWSQVIEFLRAGKIAEAWIATQYEEISEWKVEV